MPSRSADENNMRMEAANNLEDHSVEDHGENDVQDSPEVAEPQSSQTEIAAGSTTAGSSGIDASDIDNAGFGTGFGGAAGLGAGAGAAAGFGAGRFTFGRKEDEEDSGEPQDSENIEDPEEPEYPEATTEGAEETGEPEETEATEDSEEDAVEEEERKKKRRRTILALLGLLLLLLLVFVGCRSVFGGDDASGNSELTSADVQPVSTEGIVNRIAVSGTIEPEDQSTVEGTGGATIKSVDVAVGDRVERDQVLVVIDTADLDEQLAEAERNADDVRKQGDEAVAAAEKEYERLKDLAAQGNATIIYNGTEYTLSQARSNPDIEPEALQQALTEANVVDTGVTQQDVDAQAKVVRDTRKSAEDADKEAEKAVDKIQEEIDKASVKSNLDGVVTEVRAKEGETAEGVLLKVANDSTFKLRGAVKETDIDKVEEGSEVTFTTPVTGDKEFTGEVTSISPVAGGNASAQDQKASSASSSASGSGNSKVTFPVEITVTGDTEGLRMGASARAKILQEIAQDTMSVPAEAVYTNDSGSQVVLVVTRDSRVTEREVATGETDGYSVAVESSDLKSSDRVILQPSMHLDLKGKKATVSTGASS